MAIKAVLFDLDGTLLPMDQDKFTKGYFELLARKLAPLGYDGKELVAAVWSGMAGMVKNDGRESNESAFWREFSGALGERAMGDKPVVEEFYKNEFEGAKVFCGFDPQAAKCVQTVKAMGLRTALASNPVFPRAAMEARIRWAGLAPEEFELITSYETIGACKPNPAYYTEIARRLGLEPQECLMVGNDVEEDMEAAQAAGMAVFLLTNDLINAKRRDISVYPRGSFQRALGYINDELGRGKAEGGA